MTDLLRRRGLSEVPLPDECRPACSTACPICPKCHSALHAVEVRGESFLFHTTTFKRIKVFQLRGPNPCCKLDYDGGTGGILNLDNHNLFTHELLQTCDVHHVHCSVCSCLP